MTPPNNQNENPTVASLLRNSFDSYESMINRYAELLKETNSLSTLIKEKIVSLATSEQMNNKIEDINKLIDKKMETFNKVAETKVESSNKDLEASKKSLESTVNTLTFRLNLVIAVLSAIFVIGGVAFTYIKYIIDAKLAKQTETIIETRGQINQPGIVPYWIDENHNKRYIYLEKQTEKRTPQGTIAAPGEK